ncbi:hypothetical protein FisN_14Lh220 [Fistulifera solaris]|uniref:Uncharacterized protein n=1 Tax=Fistulifera solaris TaxID=1519565 RepID=A0A1Z5J9Y6_FISSO|nr:hypothetical protein FisN_14Lh220 [Fistulifera solaris]|eukprot:GAX10702.1 hypothetical protein FisN_14Lh220 [Fistulifera solaris]
MANNTPDSFEPVLVSALDPELQMKFMALFEESYDIFFNEAEVERAGVDTAEAAAVSWIQHVREEVSAHSIFARTMSPYEKGDMRSLLDVVCEKFNYAGPDITKYLIEVSPHALLWERRGNSLGPKLTPIQLIGNFAWSCELFPWIMERYPWVFEHKLCRTKKPHLKMMRFYASQQISNETVRRFYELYPQGLREKDSEAFMGGFPLTISMSGAGVPDADTFIWMAQQYPEAVYHRNNRGYTVLHKVCSTLAVRQLNLEIARHLGNAVDAGVPTRCTPNVAKICRFLIAEHPSLIRQQVQGHGYLPVHMLANRCNRPLVQEIAVLLLRAYPDCVIVKAGKFRPELSSVPFIQQVYPLILDELAIDEEISMLFHVVESMAKAAAFPTSRTTSTDALGKPSVKASLLGSVSEVFRSWTNLRVSDVLTARKQSLNERIADTCLLFEEEDRYEDRYDEFSGAEYLEFLSVTTFNDLRRGGDEQHAGREDSDASSSVINHHEER